MSKLFVIREIWPFKMFMPVARWGMNIILKIQTSMLVAACYRIFAKSDSARWRWETDRPPPAAKLCVFVTYAPTGEIPDRAIHHAAIWQDAGYSIVFVIALDNITHRPIIPFGYALCRENKGHDFAAWSRALSQLPLDNVRSVATVNDSVYANSNLERAIRRAEDSKADVIGFTECREYRWHIQSYAVVFKGDCIRSEAFRRFWSPRIGSRRHVILTYEVQLARTMTDAGYITETLFPLAVKSNPTAHYWPELLAQGFPYLKRSLLPERRAEWMDLAERHGFDTAMINADCPP